MADDCQESDAAIQLDSPSAADAQVLTDEEVKKKKCIKIGRFWNKPVSKIYADNFGFGVNGYQCMIDYLDTKDYGGRPKKGDIRLPLLEERCLDSFSSKKPFKFYENPEIDDLINKGEKIRDQIRQNDVASPGNVLRRTHTNWSMTKKYVQLVKNTNVVDYRKIREQSALEERGILVPEVLKNYGVGYSTDRMDPLNLTLYKAHNNLDHAILMNSRRERLTGMDDQMDVVVSDMSDKTADLDRRAKKEMKARNRSTNLTPYDKAQSMAELMEITEDLAARNKLRRQLEYQALEDGVDDVVRLDRSRNRFRNNLRNLNESVRTMEDEVSTMRRRHREERGDDYDLPASVLRAQADKKARRVLNLHVDDADISDPDLARLRMRKAHDYEILDDPAVTPFHKYRDPMPDTVSDVQTRVLARAGEMAGQTSTQRHVNNRARYINIYVPKYNTADPDGIVKPSRTELNIDHMAKTLAQKGRIQRRYGVEDEADLPVSNLNTMAQNRYVKREYEKPVDQVPSNSLRVRSAVCRARQRNALQGR